MAAGIRIIEVMKNKRKKPRGGIGCLIGGYDDTSDEELTSQHHLLRVEVVPLSEAFSLIDAVANNDTKESTSKNSSRHSNDRRRVRIVHPYPYSYHTFAKSRWLGRQLIDVYHDEFGSYPKSYYEAAINAGRILVSDRQVACDYLVKQGDELTHIVHRHEPAVGLCHDVDNNDDGTEAQTPPIHVIHDDDSLLVVDKPASMPIHACGAYNFNSLMEVLSYWKPDTYGTGKLFTVHRLDRLTSGLVLIAKSSSLAKSLSKCIVERDNCQKIYLARVKGRFPDILQNIDHPWRLTCWASKKEVAECIDGEENTAETQLKQRKIATVPPISHGEVASDDVCINGGVQLQLPVNNNLKKQSKKSNNIENQQRCIAALGFWITGGDGILIEDATVQDFMKQGEIVSAREIVESVGSDLSNETQQSIRWLHFACPCRISSHKNGVCEAGDFSGKSESELADIKPAQTAFTLLSYDEATDTSLLLVKPDTGRMHQIRLHLQALGHPIANDHRYGGELWFGDEEGQKSFQNSRQWLDRLDKGSSSSELTISNVPATDEEIYQVVANKSRDDGESIEDFIKKTCVWCARCRGVDAIHNFEGSAEELKRKTEVAVFQRTLMEYLVRSQGIWLHALHYSLNINDEKGRRTVRYTTEFPSWAL